VYLSLSAVIDRVGVEGVLRLELDESEIIGLRRSAEVLKSTIAQLDL
jgi:malate/lactate dehydrogenase